MQLIPLTRGLFAKVDDCDYEWIMDFKWHATRAWNERFYAQTTICFPGHYRRVQMHRMVFGPLPHEDVDHKDRDGLNNCRDNLRVCNDLQNQANTVVRRGSLSGFKGVHWNTKRRRWLAMLVTNGKTIYLGSFMDKESAARAYDAFLLPLHGEFARTNQSLGLLSD